MKNLSRCIFDLIIFEFLLVFDCLPSDAASRGAARSAYDGTWSVAIYTLRGGCGSVRVAARIVGGRDRLMLHRSGVATEPFRRHRQGHEEQADQRARDGRGSAEEFRV